MEASKKQADLLADMEEQLAKARKQEEDYQGALDSMQTELEEAEQEIIRLKQNSNNVDRQGEFQPLFPAPSRPSCVVCARLFRVYRFLFSVLYSWHSEVAS